MYAAAILENLSYARAFNLSDGLGVALSIHGQSGFPSILYQMLQVKSAPKTSPISMSSRSPL